MIDSYTTVTITTLSDIGRNNAMEEKVLLEINCLRQKLVELVDQKGTFLDDDVIQLSQLLDLLIVGVQTARTRKTTNYMNCAV
jgi:hypothetical protein